MSSNNYNTSDLPIVSPPPVQVVSDKSRPTYVGRSLDFGVSTTAHNPTCSKNDEKENTKLATAVTTFNSNKNKATVIPASPPPAKKSKTEATESKPNFKIDKYCVEELKDILRLNGQHVTGRKEELIVWILDGEKYGRLSYCPDCGEGRLKVRPHHPDIVYCPGHYDGYYGVVVGCGYVVDAEDAPRSGKWLGPKLRRIEIPEVSPADKIKAEYKKMSKKDLGDLLISKGQDGKGNKKFLLDRIVDAKLHGLLGKCPGCDQGALVIEVGAPDQVVCSRKSKFCSYHCTADAAPRTGKWDA